MFEKIKDVLANKHPRLVDLPEPISLLLPFD
jgi:hypothetical protein